MKRLCMAVVGAAFTALLTGATAPVKAAPLDFNFTTVSGATGTFTLETDTAPSADPAFFAPDAPEAIGIAYPNAVSNFSVSAPYLNLSNVTTDFAVAPFITSDFLGFPANLGVLSGVSYPQGCITTPGFTCLFDVAVLYSGNLSQLPQLSDNPLSYPTGVAIDFYNPITQELLIRDFITNLQVVRKQPVPESDSNLGILAFSLGGVGLLLKRKMNTKKQLAT